MQIAYRAALALISIAFVSGVVLAQWRIASQPRSYDPTAAGLELAVRKWWRSAEDIESRPRTSVTFEQRCGLPKPITVFTTGTMRSKLLLFGSASPDDVSLQHVSVTATRNQGNVELLLLARPGAVDHPDPAGYGVGPHQWAFTSAGWRNMSCRYDVYVAPRISEVDFDDPHIVLAGNVELEHELEPVR